MNLRKNVNFLKKFNYEIKKLIFLKIKKKIIPVV